MKKRFTTTGSLSLLLALAGPPSCSTPAAGPSGAHEDSDPEPPPSVSITSINGAGSGCREPGTISFTAAPDGSTTSLAYKELTIDSSPSVGFQHINCTTSLVYHVAAGWQITATVKRVHGAAHLTDGARAKVTTSLFLAGSRLDVSGHQNLSGPSEGPFIAEMDAPGDEIVSPCGTDTLVNINTSLDLEAPASSQPGSSVKVEAVELKLAIRAC